VGRVVVAQGFEAVLSLRAQFPLSERWHSAGLHRSKLPYRTPSHFVYHLASRIMGVPFLVSFLGPVRTT